MTAGHKHTDDDGRIWTQTDCPVYVPGGLWFRYEDNQLHTASGRSIGVTGCDTTGRHDRKVFRQLSPEVIITGSRRQVTALILGLCTCEAHRGVHHFAVIAEGRQIACTETAAQCLRDQGIEFGLS